MSPRDKIAAIDAIDGLKPHTELIDAPVQPEEEGRGGEEVKWLNLRRNLRKLRLVEIALSELLFDGIQKAQGGRRYGALREAQNLSYMTLAR